MQEFNDKYDYVERNLYRKDEKMNIYLIYKGVKKWKKIHS
jgi:hypothetical protein